MSAPLPPVVGRHPLPPLAAALGAALALALALAGCGEQSVSPGGEPVPRPAIEGPVTAGRGPFVAGTAFTLADVGYRQDEFFITGTARSFASTGPLDPTGQWSVEPADTAAYRTRILVLRPIDAARFDGTVVVEWLNVSGGLDAAPDWIGLHTELVRSGNAWVGVSAQYVGVDGGSAVLGNTSTSLKRIDPERYGSLVHPGDSFSYDIFSQAGRAIRAAGAVDPLGGLRPRRVIAVGESQSAFRLTTYVNAIDPVSRVFDAFFIHSRGGGSAAIAQAPQEVVATPGQVFVREDVRVPVITVQTESDLIGLRFAPDRQRDSRHFRLWEIAGTAHADVYTLFVGFSDTGGDPATAAIIENAEPIPGIIRCGSPVNSGPHHFVLKAAFAALRHWVETGEAPPGAPRLELVGNPAAIARDRLGNALGGIRTPHVDVPIATLSGEGQTGGAFCSLFGTTALFDEPTLRSLYASREDYVSKVREATARAVESGWILAADADLFPAAAANATFP